jgi:ribonuclease HII
VAKKKLGPVDWTAIQPSPVVGVDEVGRGCLAGPVVAAAVILSYPQKKVFTDSKLVPAVRREELLIHVQSEHRFAVGFASVEEINVLNIFHASLLAMRRAVEGLNLGDQRCHVVVDGKFRVPGLPAHIDQTAFVKGDLRCEPISAASIVAKVTRDRYMRSLAENFPEYGFEIHKGYATLHHRDMLAALGPSSYHRAHFRGVRLEDAIESGDFASAEF